MVNVKSEAENKQLELMALLNTDQPVLPAESYLIALESPVSGTFNYQQTADAQYQQDRLKALDKEVKCAKTWLCAISFAYAPYPGTHFQLGSCTTSTVSVLPRVTSSALRLE